VLAEDLRAEMTDESTEETGETALAVEELQ
jgi:hypothetical protein